VEPTDVKKGSSQVNMCLRTRHGDLYLRIREPQAPYKVLQKLEE